MKLYQQWCRLRTRLKLGRRHGFPPGLQNVSTSQPGESFRARPNFYWYRAIGWPSYMPVYPQPALVRGTAITEGWPCEFRSTRWRARWAGPYCVDCDDPAGDWVLVVGQVHGELVRNEHKLADGTHESSDIWNRIKVPIEKLRPGIDPATLRIDATGMFVYGYVPDLWFGNTGWHDIPDEEG